MLTLMRQESTLDKRKKGRPITDSDMAIWIRDRLYPFLMVLTGVKVKYKVVLVNEPEPVPEKPIIFAANHSAFQDTPIMLLLRAVRQRSYIFSGKQDLYFID